MREAFHDDLQAINHSLIDMANFVRTSMERATTALLEADLALAEQVIEDDEHVDAMQHELDDKTMQVIARQAPVAGDLRALITSLRMSSDFERMGDFAHHIARIARMRYPIQAVPHELHDTISDLGGTVSRLIEKVARLLDTRDLSLVFEIEKDDDDVDRLHRKLFVILLDESWQHGTETAIDTTLLGRYYERCADHAVSVARRMHFSITGEYITKGE